MFLLWLVEVLNNDHDEQLGLFPGLAAVPKTGAKSFHVLFSPLLTLSGYVVISGPALTGSTHTQGEHRSSALNKVMVSESEDKSSLLLLHAWF